MKRDLDRLCETEHDVLVVGGGVYGAAVAWQAAVHGLSVALIDRADFGSNTSANSQKTLRGGVGFSPRWDLKGRRSRIRERRELITLAPHLVSPLPFVVPTGDTGGASKALWRLALAGADILRADRNNGIGDPALELPRSRVLSAEDAVEAAPPLAGVSLTWAARWYDAQVYDTERLTLAYVRSAVDRGAVAANYVEASRLLERGARIRGVEAVDQLTGTGVELRARLVVNCAGPDAPALQATSARSRSLGGRAFVKGVNVVTRAITGTAAIGVPAIAGPGIAPRSLFLVPWRGVTIVGTAYSPHDVGDDPYSVDEDTVTSLLVAANASCSEARLSREDVRGVHVGLVPAGSDGRRPETRTTVIDESAAGGPEGLVSVLGVELVSAHATAARVARLVCRKLERAAGDSGAVDVRLRGAGFGSVEALLEAAVERLPQGIQRAAAAHVARSYGADFEHVYAIAERELPGHLGATDFALKAQVAYAAREEMAVMLTDAVFGRTGLGTAGHPGESALADAADVMAAELGWSAAEKERQLEAVREVYRADGVEPPSRFLKPLATPTPPS